MKNRYLLTAALAALSLAGVSSMKADVFYFGLQNIAIPNDFNGVYVNLQTGVVPSPTFGGSPNWDINPFFGGDGVANSPFFQPARIGTNNQDRIVNLGFGTTISAGGQMYSTGYGGSQGHIGAGADQFQANTPGYIGYQYTPGGAAGPYSGWMRAILNQNTAGGMLMDWAYETNPGGSIAAGNIQQAVPVGGDSVFTLTANGAEAPRLGSVIADGTYQNTAYSSSVVKNGTGSWTLGSGPGGVPHSYTGSTTVNAGTLIIDNANTTTARLSGTSGITVNSGGTLLFAQTGQVSTDRINNAANVTLGAGGSPGTGGRLNTGGLSEGTAPTGPGGAGGIVGAMTLTMNANSVIDFTSANGGSILVFNAFSLASGTAITIDHWTGMAGANGLDKLLFATNPGLTLADLMNVQFTNDAGLNFALGGQFIDFNGYFELVPVPEPGTWAAGLLTVAALGYSQRRRLVRSLKRA